MAWLRHNSTLKRIAAMFLVTALVVLPLVHTGAARAAAPEQAQAESCCTSGCDSCPCCPETAHKSCCTDEDSPYDPATDGDEPCDCPCCGKLLPAVPMISTPSMDGPFWADSPTPTPLSLAVRPDSAVVSVDIQPPIV